MSATNEKKFSAYSGRWIAVINEKVVGHGGTPMQAIVSAKNLRRKEKPRVVFVSANVPFNIPPIIKEIQTILPKSQEIFLVGGAVRDLFLKRPINDFDFTLPGNTFKVARKIAN